MNTRVIVALFGALAAAAFPAIVFSQPAKAPEVHASSAAVHVSSAAAQLPPIGVTTNTVSSLYTGDRVRDPFLAPSAGGAPARRPEERTGPLVVDIHALQLRGILKDQTNDFAIFSTDAGLTLLLRAGRLYDDRNKPVPGITGKIRLKQKTVQLVTADKDVQIFQLGETNEDKEKEREKTL